MTEMLVVGVVALIVVGPKDLPILFRKAGEFVGRMKGMAREFSSAMNAAADEAGIKETAESLRKMSDPKQMGLDELNDAVDDFKSWDADSETGKLSEQRKLDKLKIQEATANAAAARQAKEVREAHAAREAAETKKAAPKKKENSTIRVDLQRLDALVNLVGELVIDRTRFMNIEEQLRESHPQLQATNSLAETLQQYSRHMNDVQNIIMKVRMVPIGNAFNKYPRIVRDLARSLGKKINLDFKIRLYKSTIIHNKNQHIYRNKKDT